MKTTTITIAALLVAFGSFAQQNVEQKKSDEIKKNPALYQSQGGVIDDSMLDLPSKTKKQDYVDPNGHFIIHRADTKASDERKHYLGVKDQSSEEFKALKAEYLEKNPVPETPEESKPRSAQERNKMYNNK